MTFHKDSDLGKSEVVSVTTPPCIVCRKESEINVPADVVRNAGNAPIQHLWPEASPDQRELFLTGTHPECWALLADEED